MKKLIFILLLCACAVQAGLVSGTVGGGPPLASASSVTDGTNAVIGALHDTNAAIQIQIANLPTGGGNPTTNASALNTGTLPDARLGTNVAMLNAPSVTFTGAVSAASFTGSGAGLTNVPIRIAHCVLYADKSADITIGTNSYHTNFPSSTTAGMQEIQSLFPYSTNSILSTAQPAFVVDLNGGLRNFTTPITLSNNCIIRGSIMQGTCFNYVGPTNGFTVDLVTNYAIMDGDFNIPRSGSGCIFSVRPYVDETQDGLQAFPTVVLEDFSIRVATNMPAIILQADAMNFYARRIVVGGPELFTVTNSLGISPLSGFLNPEQIAQAPGLIGFQLIGSTANHLEDCQAVACADGIIITSPGYQYIDRFQMCCIGKWANGTNTLYPATSPLRLGAGIWVMGSYACRVTSPIPYKCNIGIAVNWAASEVSVDDFQEQYSEYAFGLYYDPDVGDQVTLALSHERSASYLSYAITNKAEGPFGVDDTSVTNLNPNHFCIRHLNPIDSSATMLWVYNNTTIVSYDPFTTGFTINPAFPLHANGAYLTSVPATAIAGNKFTGTFPGVGTTLYITNGIIVTNSTP